MATTVRANISKKNEYWIDKHRHYELKHFCLQYPNWKREYAAYDIAAKSSSFDRIGRGNDIPDPTADIVMKLSYYDVRISLVEKAAKETDQTLYPYILKAVTEGLSYTYLKNALSMPCSKDLYYNRYRKFFWILNKMRG